MTNQILQQLNPPLCPPEVEMIVSSPGDPVQFDSYDGTTYEWPDLYQGVAATPDGNLPGYITPYIGNVASGTLTGGPTYRQYPVNTSLTFSGMVSSVPSGVLISAQNWNFGDGFTAIGPVVNHTYSDQLLLQPGVQAVLGVEFSNGAQVFTPKQMNLYHAGGGTS